MGAGGGEEEEEEVEWEEKVIGTADASLQLCFAGCVCSKSMDC